MCRSTAGPLLAMVGVAGTAAGVVLAIVRERVDRLSDARAARMAAEGQNAPNGLKQDRLKQDSVEDESGESGTSESGPVESEADASK